MIPLRDLIWNTWSHEVHNTEQALGYKYWAYIQCHLKVQETLTEFMGWTNFND